MKVINRILAAFLLAVCWALVMCSCVTETTRVITTDKAGTVTDTTVTRKGSDPATLKLVEIAASVYLPRPAMVVRAEKSAPPSELRRILRGRPITELEIAFRWKPLPR